MYQHGWYQYRKEIYEENHEQFIGKRQFSHITKDKEGQKSYKREIEWCEDQTHHPCCKYDIFFFHFLLSRATGIPNCSRYLVIVLRAIGYPFSFISEAKVSSLFGF